MTDDQRNAYIAILRFAEADSRSRSRDKAEPYAQQMYHNGVAEGIGVAIAVLDGTSPLLTDLVTQRELLRRK